ncbi:unnamed protein product [Adineta steineri]|nr:unnamed protein product [Adineta steineri]
MAMVAYSNRTTHRNELMLLREKQIISKDEQYGENIEFVITQMVHVRNTRYILVVQAKRDSLGKGLIQLLLALKSMSDINNDQKMVYGFVTTAINWQLITYDGQLWKLSEPAVALLGNMGTKEDRWLKQNTQILDNNRNRGGAAARPIDDIILCLPSTFDLTPQLLLQHFDLLLIKLNASNAKYISDAILNVRVCLILSLFHFIGKTCSKENINIIWKVLEKAAMDNYPPIIKSLFASPQRTSRSRSSKLKTSLKEIFERFVKGTQFKVLDHPTSLEARLWA